MHVIYENIHKRVFCFPETSLRHAAFSSCARNQAMGWRVCRCAAPNFSGQSAPNFSDKTACGAQPGQRNGGDSEGQGAAITARVEPFWEAGLMYICINGRDIALELRGLSQV